MEKRHIVALCGTAPVAALTTAEPYDATKDIEFFATPRVTSRSSRRATRTGQACTSTARTSRARPSSR